MKWNFELTVFELSVPYLYTVTLTSSLADLWASPSKVQFLKITLGFVENLAKYKFGTPRAWLLKLINYG